MKDNPVSGGKARKRMKRMSAASYAEQPARKEIKRKPLPAVRKLQRKEAAPLPAVRKIQKKTSTSVPAKNTGGAEKKSWGGWSPPKKVTASKKTAARVQRRGEQARGMR